LSNWKLFWTARLKDKTNGLGKLKKTIDKNAKELLIRFSGGDARVMLNGLEIAAKSYKTAKITPVHY
jgi:replication-associated recombination protein RarA